MITPLRIGLLSAALALSFTPRTWATTVLALTAANEIMVVDADVPQNIVSIRAITGLLPGEQVLGIDVRPSNNRLYGLAASANFTAPRLYTINPISGAATLVAALFADPSDTSLPFAGLSGAHFAIDFNPAADRLRVVSDTGQNLRIVPDTAGVITDGVLAYATPLASPPNIMAIAYANNVAGTTTTSLFGIDDANFKIVLQNPPNNGTLVNAVDFGLVNATHPGFDISPEGMGFVAGRHTVPPLPEEYILATIDPITGAGESRGVIGDGSIAIRDIAIGTSFSFSAPRFSVFEEAGSATITVRRDGFQNLASSVQFATLSGSASAGSDYNTASGTLSFAANETTKTFVVPIKNDSIPEGDELLTLILTDVTGQAVVGAPGIATLRINAGDRRERVGPQVIFVGLTGPSRGISGAVVCFNEDMDPASVSNVGNYRLNATPKRGRIQSKAFRTAVYDPVDRKVTLTLTPFGQTNFTAMSLRVRGLGATGVRDVNRNLLDGNRDLVAGGDAVQAFKVFTGKVLRFLDRDGDRVTLTLGGGGTSRLDGVLPLGGPATQQTQFWILDPIALKTTFNGTVTKGPRGDGILIISEIIGLDKKEFAPISTNPAFRINRLTFSSNATGNGLP